MNRRQTGGIQRLTWKIGKQKIQRRCFAVSGPGTTAATEGSKQKHLVALHPPDLSSTPACSSPLRQNTEKRSKIPLPFLIRIHRLRPTFAAPTDTSPRARAIFPSILRRLSPVLTLCCSSSSTTAFPTAHISQVRNLRILIARSDISSLHRTTKHNHTSCKAPIKTGFLVPTT